MIRPLIAVLPLIVGAPLARAEPPSEIFFHWGDIDGNKKLLNLGGYSVPEHFAELSAGGAAELNEAVLTQARQWYLDAGKPDVAGAGFYMSPDPFNSRGFGHDLLVVEVVKSTPGPLAVTESFMSIKQSADKALAEKAFDELPLATRYRNDTGWHVISRAPSARESAEIRILFHPPRAEDVERIWKEKIIAAAPSEGYSTPLQRIRRIAREVLEATSETAVTRSADIVFQRLLFDHAPEYLAKAIDPALLSAQDGGKVQGLDGINEIFRAFDRKIPDDPRTDRLFATLFEGLSANPKLNDPSALTFVAENLRRLPEARRVAGYDWAMKAFPEEILKLDPISYLKMADSVFDRLPSRDRARVRQLATELTAELRVTAKDFPEVQRLLGRVHGPRGRKLAVRMFQNEIRKLVTSSASNHNPNPRVQTLGRMDPMEAGRQLMGNALTIAAERERLPRELFDELAAGFMEELARVKPYPRARESRAGVALALFDQVHDAALKERLKRFAREELAKEFRYLTSANSSTYRWEKDPGVLKALRKLARSSGLPSATIMNMDARHLSFELSRDPTRVKRVRKVIANSASGVPDQALAINPFATYLQNHIRLPQTKAEHFEKRTLELLNAFPEHAFHMRGALDETKTVTEFFTDASIPVNWARLIRASDEIARTRDNLDELAANAYAYITRTNSVADIPPPDEATFKRRYRRSLRNIDGSPAYSELSRTFNLVDPLFVSEDIRLTGARHPFKRFNEELRVDGKLTTQPAWENFNEAWVTLGEKTWLRESHVSYPSMSHLDSALDQVHSKLVATQVDGTSGLASYVSSWDRRKYSTTVSREDWALWDLENQKAGLARYFDIAATDDGYVLKFKSISDLDKSIPGIGRYNKGGQTPFRLLKFIEKEANKLNDPIQRASRILYLTTRLHPYENGNGRFARAWAAAELVRSGLPMPVGFPTNDFVMSQRRIEIEVRKSLKLGEFWEKMVSDAHRRGIAPDDFFQKVFRGSPLEGLMHVSPRKIEDLEAYTRWLYEQKEPPEWGADFMRKLEKALYEFHAGGGRLAKIDELARARMIDETWSEFAQELARAGVKGVPAGSAPGGTPRRFKLQDCLLQRIDP